MGGSFSREDVDTMLQRQEIRLRSEFEERVRAEFANVDVGRREQQQYMESLVESIQHELVRDTKEDRFTAMVETLATRFRDRVAPVADGRVRVFFMGCVAVGKSTLVNALVGEDVAETGLDATTDAVSLAASVPMRVGGNPYSMDLYDCPGVDKSFDYTGDAFVENLAMANVLVVAYTSSIDYLESVIRIANAMSKPILFVRTCCDMETEAKVQRVIERDQHRMSRLLGRPIRCHGVSARRPQLMIERWVAFTEDLTNTCAAAVLGSLPEGNVAEDEVDDQSEKEDELDDVRSVAGSDSVDEFAWETCD